MAFERYPVPGGATYLAIETTYGTNPDDPSNLIATAGNRFFFREDFTIKSWNPQMKQRRGVSTHRQGSRPAQGEVSAEASGSFEFDWQTVDATTFPNCYEGLIMCGFVKSHTNNSEFSGPNYSTTSGTNDEIQTYTFTDRCADNGTSCRLEYLELETGAAPDGTLYAMDGCRADWTFNMVMNEVITMDVEIQGLANEETEVSTPATTHTLPAVRPIVYKGAHGIALRDVASDTVFGGGTVAAPYIGVGNTSNDSNVEVLGITLQGVRNLQADMAPGVSTGIKRIWPAVGDPFTGTIVIEQTTFETDWDIVDWINKGQVLQLTVLLQDPQTTGDFFKVDLSFVVMSKEHAVEGGRRTVTLNIESAYAEVSTDGGGLVPGNPFTATWATVVAA